MERDTERPEASAVPEGASLLPLLTVKNIVKEFSGIRVLDNVSLSLHAGEVLGIIGENGAGKSTLLKIISGIYTPTEGIIEVEGRTVGISDSGAARKLGITMIPQEFNLVNDLNVFENIFLGRELRRGFLLDKSAMIDRARELLARLNTDISPMEKIENLSVAQKQMVEFAKALSVDSRILIMDEPTTVLTSNEIELLFEVIRDMQSQGVGIVYISHKLQEVKEICDRVAVLRDGVLVGVDRTENLTVHEMATRMVGRELSQIFPEKACPKDEIVLDVRGLDSGRLLKDVSFDLRRGEILGFAGLVGAGRTEVAEVLMGLRRKDAGVVQIMGRRVDVRNPAQAVANGLSYLSEDRQGKGIMVRFGIVHNVTLVSLADYCRNGFIDQDREYLKAEDYVEEFGIRAASLYRNLEFFSGGNQQKVSLAKSLDSSPQILIVDEPTRGIDVNAKREIYHFIRKLTDDGLSCIFISSELEEIIGMCNRVVVMHGGRVAGILEGDAISEKEIMFLATNIG